MKKFNVETGVGILLIFGFICMAYLSIQLGDVKVMGTNQYPVKAVFANISGLKEGALVEIAGVEIGRVKTIRLDNYEARVEMLINPDVKLQDDSLASIRTKGIIGDKYIKVQPGGSEKYIAAGGSLTQTESAVEIEELISKYIFNKE